MSPIRKRYLFQFISILIFFILGYLFLLILISNEINKSLEKTYYNKLNVTKNTLKVNIENYFENKTRLIMTISDNEETANAFQDFSQSFQKLENEYVNKSDYNKFTDFIDEHTKKVVYDLPKATAKKKVQEYLPANKNGIILQNLYILENRFPVGQKDKLKSSSLNLSYDKAHEKYHQRFLNILNKHKFYDIFLIDTNGNIVYSVFKELDLGTNLKTGVYAESSLAKAYQKSLENKKFGFCDFKPYEPSYNQPAAFFAMPVQVDGKLLGTIAFQVSIDEINEIVTFDSKWEEIGLGKSGEAYLIGKDYLMRSDSRFKKGLNNKVVDKLDTTIGILNIKSDLTTTALSGVNKSGEFINYKNEKVLSSFTSINIFDQVWALIVQIKKDEVNKEIDETIYFVMIISIVILALIMIVLWFVALNIIVRPLESFEKKLEIQVNEKTKELNELNISLEDKVQKQISVIREKDNILLHQSRMAAIGEMMHNIAHQWRQPLSIISMHSSTMKVELALGENISKSDSLQCFEEINKQAQYLSQTINDFVSFYNSNTATTAKCNLLTIFEKTESLIESSFVENGIKLYVDCDKEISIEVNENHLIQIFLNIFNNCKDAIVVKKQEDKFVFVKVSQDNENTTIKIKDSGGGIEDEIIEKIFDPYTTTKHAYIGTGIALYMSYQLITQVYNGTIKVKNVEYEKDGKSLNGAEFTITLPLKTDITKEL